MRIRDDGVPFNPLEYQGQEQQVTLGGIPLLKKLLLDFLYMGVLNMNNTLVDLHIT